MAGASSVPRRGPGRAGAEGIGDRLSRLAERPSRAAILGAIALAVVPLLLVAGLSVLRAEAQDEARIVEQRVSLARAAAQRVDTLITDTTTALISVGQTDDVAGPNSSADLARVLARVAAVNRNLSGVVLFGADGWNLSDASAPHTVYVGDRAYFQRAVGTGQPAVSGALTGRVTDRPTAVVAVPITLRSGERGVLVSPLSLEALVADLASIASVGGARPVLFDAEGSPLLPLAGESSGASLRGRADVDAVLAGQTGSRIVPGPDGEATLAAFAPVPSAGWGLAVLEPADAALGEARQAARLVLFLIAAALLCAGGLGWWLGGRLTAAHAREQHARVGAEMAAERTDRLQAVTTALSATLTRDEVADVILSHGIAAVGARAGWIVLLADDERRLRVLHSVGLPDGILERWSYFTPGDPTAVSDAALSGEMVVLGSPKEALARYPNTDDAIRLTGNAAWVAAPLRVDGRTTGALGLSFASARHFSQADRELIETIARQCAQALERARLYEAEIAAHQAAEQTQRRLAFLASASRLLASSLDYEGTLQQVAQLAVPELADWCIVDLAEPDGSVRRIAVVHADPDRAGLALELQRRYPRLSPRARHTLRRVLETGRSWLDPEISEQRLIGEARDPEHLALLRGLGFRGEIVVPLTGRDRVLGTITLVAADASRRYDAEHLALAEDLARRCALAIENATLYQEARNAVQTRDEFLSIASHELRTPMTSVRGHAQLLRRTLERPPIDPVRIRQQADAIVRGSDRLTALIQDLLDVSRIRTGRLDLRLERFDLTSFVRDLVGRQQEQVEPPRHFRLDLPDGPCPVVADPDRVEQVLTNLLDNAVKYSPNGGEIAVLVRPDGALARISVSDHGIGVPRDALERVFEPFGRAPNAEESQVPGMGLGLFICRSIVERHGGRMWAESPGEDKGTTLVVELPLEARVEPEPAPVEV